VNPGERTDRVLMIAARAPIPGQTKTRLGRALGMERAAELYRAFLRDLADRFEGAVRGELRPFDLAWTYSPPERDFARDLAALTGRPSPPGVRFVPQDGADWGVRQTNLLRWAKGAGYARSVLMASDSPHLPVSAVLDAFAALDGRDVVLGRVRDGGYYLIGMRGFQDVLSGVAMSTASAADGVVEAAVRMGCAVGEIGATFDIDEVGDLDAFVDTLRKDPELCPATGECLRRLGLIPAGA
jgi:glycosyltransferase A (GT-A) superfamily protein (DUF2064 family)